MGCSQSTDAAAAGGGSASGPLSPSQVDSRVASGIKLGGISLPLASLQSIPPAVLQHTGWRSVDMSGNALDSVPGEVSKWSNIRTLSFADCGIHTITADLSGMTKLRKLDLSGNNLVTLPALPSALEELDLSGNPNLDFAALAHSLSSAADSLTLLRMHGTSLAELPAWLGQCSALQELDVSDNSFLTSLTLSSGGSGLWGELRALVTLKASHCSIPPAGIPQDLLESSTVHSLVLTGNTLLTPAKLRALPGMDSYAFRHSERVTKGMSGGGGQLQALCGVS